MTSATIGGNNIINNDNPNASGYLLSVVDSTDGGTVQLNQAAGTLNYYPRSGFFGIDTMYYSICDVQCPNSCDTVQVLIEVTTDFECFVPQGISPNGDGLNDNWNLAAFRVQEVEIFNSHGRSLYKKRNYVDEWYGQTNDNDNLPVGTYFYVLKLENGQSKNGWIYLNK